MVWSQLPTDHLKPTTTVATRRHETHYMQIWCNSCMYSQMFFPSAVRLWNRVPPDTCYVAPDSFKSQLLKINLIWSCTKFLSHSSAQFYFLKLIYSHSTEFLSTWAASAARYYSITELALVSEHVKKITGWSGGVTVKCIRNVGYLWVWGCVHAIVHPEGTRT